MARTVDNFKLFTVAFIAFFVLFLFILAPEHRHTAISHLIINSEKSFIPRNKKVLDAADKWKSCFAGKLSKFRNDSNGMWSSIDSVVNKCRNETAFSKIELTAVQNKDETKYHIYSTSTESSVVVTLGIGLDVRAEETLKKQLPSGSTLYAADPIYKGNGELFEPIGPYFPFAVGKETGVASASVLKNGRYITQVTSHIDIISFLSKFVKQSFIDQLLMDNEGPEYDILPMMARGREFDENGLVVCQCNVEVHSPNEKRRKQFLDIVNTIIDDGRYVFLMSFPAAGHHRLFFVNVEHPVCVEKYLSQSIQ